MDAATIFTILKVIKMLQEIKAGNENDVEKIIIDNIEWLAKAANEINWNFVGKMLEAAGLAIGNIFGGEK